MDGYGTFDVFAWLLKLMSEITGQGAPALKNNKLYRMILAGIFLAVAVVLPVITGQIPQIGNALCPMHIPVILAGFFTGPWYAAAIGLAAPLLRFLISGVPVLVPKGIAMCLELSAYGMVTGLLYRTFPRKKIYIYVTLVCAMLAGRIVWGAARVVFFGLGGYEFGWAAFMAGAFLNAIPGIVIQLVAIPVLVIALQRYTN